MGKRAGLRLDVRVDVLMDERYEALADIAGYNRYEAIGRVFALRAWVLDRQEFVLHEAVIRRFLGPRGVEAILAESTPGSPVDALALGERRDDGIYIRDTDDLHWLGERRAAAAAGGKARARTARFKVDGQFASDDDPDASPRAELAIGDECPPQHRNMVTYAIVTPNRDAVKIGISYDLRSRLASLQTSHHQPLTVLAFTHGDKERSIHERLSHLRTSGEWFSMCPELLAVLAEAGFDFQPNASQTPPKTQPSDPGSGSDPEEEKNTDLPRPAKAKVSRPPVELPEAAWTAADTLRKCVLDHQPGNVIVHAKWEPDVKTGSRLAWAKTFHAILERDGRSLKQLGDVLRFIFKGQTGPHQFVVLSPQALREKWDRIVAVMQTSSQRRPSEPVRVFRRVEAPEPTETAE